MKTSGLQIINLQSGEYGGRLLTCFKRLRGYNLLSVIFSQNRGLFVLKKVIYLQIWMFGRYLKSDIFVFFMIFYCYLKLNCNLPLSYCITI